eukprot:Skav223928  [mRNA]  locus=scaffold2593:382825:387213:+ [translate_table: standard]
MATEVPHNIAPANPTVGCFKVEPQDLHAVNKKLLDSGVAILIPEELAMKDSQGNIITGGLFAVDHKPSSDRIILDRRPFNELERRLVWARLPHGSLLTQLILPKGHSIRGSGDDLSNYFYLLKHRPDWLHRNTVGKAFDGEGYEEYGGINGKRFLLSFQVIAMGDLNAVDIAQQVHLEILRDGQCMAPNECIEFKQPLPASHTLEGLYIDDHIITQILPSRKHRSSQATFRDEELLANSRSQYERHQIPTSKNKAFEKEPNFVAWGTEVDSRSGRVGAPLIKLRQLSRFSEHKGEHVRLDWANGAVEPPSEMRQAPAEIEQLVKRQEADVVHPNQAAADALQPCSSGSKKPAAHAAADHPAAKSLSAEPARFASWKLRWNKYSKPYQRRLLEGAETLKQFLHSSGVSGSVLLEGKSKQVDEVLEQFVRAQHASGKKSALRQAKHAVLMIQIMRPRLRRSLQSTWEVLKSWEESQPSSFRAPMPLPLLAAMVCSARIRAERSDTTAERQVWFTFSTLLLVGFFGLLRPGELLNISGEDVSLPNSLTMGGSFAVIRIRRPKNARQMGVQQFIELRHADAINWLSWLKVSQGSSQPFWKSTANKFRHMFKQICVSLHIAQLRLSPASLRAGGATSLIDEGWETNRIRFLGRWSHLKSLEHYLQVARIASCCCCLPSLELESLLKTWCILAFAVLAMSATQQQPSETGEDLVKQFRKAVVAGGPLKGAQFFDVSWEDLKKAAKSYRADARFNQFAKRRLSEKALGSGAATAPAPTKPQRCWGSLKSWTTFAVTFLRARWLLSAFLGLLLLVTLSRPMFYVVLAKGLALSLRVVLRRSVGLLAILIDALLDEAAASLETALIAPPSVPGNLLPNSGYELQHQSIFMQWFWHAFFGFLGAVLGHRLRAPPVVRPPTRLRVV